MHDKPLSHKASTLATCLKDPSHICVSMNRHLGSPKVQSQVWPGMSRSETSNLLKHALELRDQPGYRRCIGTGRWLSSAPLGTPRGTACRTAAGQGPGPRWAGTWLLSSQSSLKGETHIQDSLLWLPQKHREKPLLLVAMGPSGRRQQMTVDDRDKVLWGGLSGGPHLRSVVLILKLGKDRTPPSFPSSL